MTDESTRPLKRNKDIDHGENAVDSKDNEKGFETADGRQKIVSGNVQRSSDTDGGRKTVSGII